MEPRSSIAAVFVAGLILGTGVGWLANTWFEPAQSGFATVTDQNTAVPTAAPSAIAPIDLNQTAEPAPPAIFNETITSDYSLDTGSQSTGSQSTGSQSTGSQSAGSQSKEKSLVVNNAAPVSATERFDKLLGQRRYYEAMDLYQEQIQQYNSAPRLKKRILDELNLLLTTRSNSDFSELVESYLTVYYDDIDILLLLARFNKSNDSNLEAVDVFLLAKTYAYTDIDQKTVDTHYNAFVEELDSLYTRQENWWPLLNLYSHIDSSGLMTSSDQYRQAIAHLRSGDIAFAVDKLNQLLNDSVVGESAAIALNKLADNAELSVAIPNNIRDSAVAPATDAIPLERRGNQYLVKLNNDQQNSVKLLIDTGASMTVISIAEFNAFNASGDAQEQERRVFQTAGGMVVGTVYLIPELTLGPYLLRNTQVAVIDFDSNREIDGLLGMNILGQFRFQIDQQNSQLLLSQP